MKLTFNTVAREICKREKSEHREVNITDVSRTLKHLFDILSEDARPVVWSVEDNIGPGLVFVIREISKRLRKPKRPDKKGSKP